jgi:hypothetical protein
MALDSYTGLKNSIIDYLERDDLSSYVDDFIDLAESRHKREIRIRDMLSRSTLAIAKDDQYINLPADFLDLKYLRVQVPDTTTGRSFSMLEQLSIHELSSISIKDAAPPRFFSVHAQIELQAPADQAYTSQIFYYQEIAGLSDANTTNVILDKAPAVYLYASLAASAPFLMHDERVQLWENLYAQARDTLNVSEQDNRRGGPLVARAHGVR